MNEHHDVIVHHIDGECSTEGTFESRSEAIQAALAIARTLDKREHVSACGYEFRGQKLAEVSL